MQLFLFGYEISLSYVFIHIVHVCVVALLQILCQNYIWSSECIFKLSVFRRVILFGIFSWHILKERLQVNHVIISV